MSSQRVVVTGLGTTSPVGGDVPTTWAALLAGKSGIVELTEDWAEQLPVRIAAKVAVEPLEVLDRVKARRLDRAGQFALISALEAWADSGLDENSVDPERLGVAIASGIDEHPHLHAALARLHQAVAEKRADRVRLPDVVLHVHVVAR